MKQPNSFKYFFAFFVLKMVNALAKLKLKTEFILNARKTVVDDSRFSGISQKPQFYYLDLNLFYCQ